MFMNIKNVLLMKGIIVYKNIMNAPNIKEHINIIAKIWRNLTMKIKNVFMKMINVFPNIYIAKVIQEMIEPFVSLLFHMINQMENLCKIITNVLWKLMVVK